MAPDEFDEFEGLRKAGNESDCHEDTGVDEH